MKYQTTAGFDHAYAKLPREHGRLFIEAVRGQLLAALAAGAHRGEVPWPKRLRAHKVGGIYSLTWSFASRDGRSLFSISTGVDGEPVLTWLAIGYHDVYQ
ncbi:MAG: hypothetical protein ACRDZX_09390 [Acidimicrobiales bacterium]